jgi:hypothetical protein
MPLNKAQLMVPPDGPGIIGAVRAGTNIVIDPDGTINAVPDDGFTLTLPLPSGTKMIFTNATAPRGWVLDTANVDSTLRVMNAGAGTGGSLAFSTVFANQTVTGTVNLSGLTVNGTVAGTQVNQNQLPSHTHSYLTRNQCCTENVPQEAGQMARTNTNTDATGGNQAHNHGWSGTISGSGTFTGGTVDLRVKYVDCIVCAKA